MVFDLTISKIEDSLLSMGWTKATVNFVTHDLEDVDGVIDDGNYYMSLIQWKLW